jgi:hypothetical protein
LRWGLANSSIQRAALHAAADAELLKYHSKLAFQESCDIDSERHRISFLKP